MPNGKPGDHPITDLMIHHLAVYGEPLDTELRQLGQLMSITDCATGLNSSGTDYAERSAPTDRCCQARGVETRHDEARLGRRSMKLKSAPRSASNQSMKPRATLRGKFIEIAIDPARGLSPSR
jgi:hypothetical protein